MNPRHAAALALVGRYLMVPPHPTATTLDSDAPLSKWRVYEVFDTAVTCNTAQASEEQDWKSKADADANNAVTKFLVKSWLGVTPVEWTAEGLRLTLLSSDSF